MPILLAEKQPTQPTEETMNFVTDRPRVLRDSEGRLYVTRRFELPFRGAVTIRVSLNNADSRTAGSDPRLSPVVRYGHGIVTLRSR
jgi:hypothetical protein